MQRKGLDVLRNVHYSKHFIGIVKKYFLLHVLLILQFVYRTIQTILYKTGIYRYIGIFTLNINLIITYIKCISKITRFLDLNDRYLKFDGNSFIKRCVQIVVDFILPSIIFISIAFYYFDID